jgi:Tfp pilus assembly protein PilX
MHTTSIVKNQSEQGSITVIALMILVVLTLLGITITRTSTIDVRIAGNEIPFKQNFYVAEGGINREAAEVGAGNYPVMNINAFPVELANQTAHNPRHKVAGADYDFSLDYEGFFLPPQGYSVVHFSRYDYNVDSFGDPTGSNIHVGSRYYKIGPKAE